MFKNIKFSGHWNNVSLAIQFQEPSVKILNAGLQELNGFYKMAGFTAGAKYYRKIIFCTARK